MRAAVRAWDSFKRVCIKNECYEHKPCTHELEQWFYEAESTSGPRSRFDNLQFAARHLMALPELTKLIRPPLKVAEQSEAQQSMRVPIEPEQILRFEAAVSEMHKSNDWRLGTISGALATACDSGRFGTLNKAHLRTSSS